MKKFLKWFFFLASAGAAIGLVIAYFCKSGSEESGENAGSLTEEEDFDLDMDLKPASERGYVSLHRDGETAASAEEEDAASAGKSAEQEE